MTTDDILNLDCNEEKNQKILQKVLRKVKPLSKCSDEYVPIELLEKVIKKISLKYDISIHCICPDVSSSSSGIIWKVNIINKNFKTLKNVFGITMYECLAKTTIYMYSKTRGKN